MGKKSKPKYEELEAYVQKLENKVYRTLRTEAINRTLFDIATALNASGSLQELYRSIHEILSSLLDMTNFYIAIYYEKRNAIRFVYHVDGHDPALNKVKWVENFTQDRSLTGDVILAKHPLLLKEDQLKELEAQGRVKGIVPKVWLGVPLMIKQQVMGVMVVQSYTNPEQYTESDVDVLTFVSDQIALSIEAKRAQEQLLRTRERLIQNEKLEAIGTLAGGIAHDFNNTLSITLGNINLAQMMVSNPELVQILDDAETSVMQAKELASRFIVFAKGGAIVKAKTNSKDFITRALSSICEKASVSYQLDLGQIPEFIEISSQQLKEAMRNIVINAHEAMDGKKEVRVSFKNHPVKENFVNISIIDTGKGIDPKNIEKVFEPYYSTKEFGKDKGTGLGMSIAYSIVKSHKGEILIGSSPNSGTRVDIVLPVSQSQELELEAAAARTDRGGKSQGTTAENGQKKATGQEAKKGKPVRVLVMDDDAMILAMSSKVLSRLGYEAVTAKNGEQAVQEYKNALNSGDPISCVILDLEVKQGMGGAQTIAALKKLDPDVKAVIASGYSSDKIMENCEEFGFAMAIAKPYSMDTLKNALQTLSPRGKRI